MLSSVYEAYSFWDLDCYKCSGSRRWEITSFSWRMNSCVAVATCRTCGAPQFLKRYYRPGISMKYAAKREYDVLQRLGAASGPPVLLPRVYNYSPERRAFSMQYLYGYTMSYKLWHASDSFEFDKCIVHSAAWLRGLHQKQGLDADLGSNTEALVAHAEEICAPLGGRQQTARWALNFMRTHCDTLAMLSKIIVPMHGDFKPSNLIWTDEGVYGIDIGLRFKNHGAMDIAQFIADILLNRLWAPSELRCDLEASHVLTKFLQAYGDNSEENQLATTWYLLYFLLCRWQRKIKFWNQKIKIDSEFEPLLCEVMRIRA